MESYNLAISEKLKPSLEGINVPEFSISINGTILFEKSSLKINKGKYGLIGPNGCGKTTLLKHLANRSIPIHENISVLYVEQEVDDTDETPIEVVFKANKELLLLKNRECEIEKMLEDNIADDNIMNEYEEIQEKLNMLSIDTQIPEIKKLLKGLGFSEDDMKKKVTDFSGGWRMRISLARALYIKPDILLLDEPTNHLDLLAILWLSDYLSNYEKIVLIVSHNVGFLNNVCSHILNIENKMITTYKGNYYMFKKALKNKQKTIEKEYQKYEKKLRSMKKNPKKTKADVQKFIKESEVKKPEKEYLVRIPFEDIKTFRDNLITVSGASAGYENKIILSNIELGISTDSRITIVGKNGSGKSTLIKLLIGEIEPMEGEVRRQDKMRISYYHQHFDSQLPNDLNPVEFLSNMIPEDILVNGNRVQTVRKYLGHLGLNGKFHLNKISELSGGQKARVALVKIIFEKPHLILMDEPTNHLDLETIQGLIDGLKEYNGGLVVITHEPEMITQLDSQLLIVEDNKVIQWKESFEDYVDELLEDS